MVTMIVSELSCRVVNMIGEHGVINWQKEVQNNVQGELYKIILNN